MPGMHGTVAAGGRCSSELLGTRSRPQADSGSRRGKPRSIHADIDPAEIGKNRHADVPIVGDVKAVITELDAMLRHHHSRHHRDGRLVGIPERCAQDLPAELWAAERSGARNT